MSAKGQTATELIMVLSAVLIILAIIYIASQQQLISSQNVLRVSQARASVNDLSIAAQEVYSEGPGSRRRVFVEIPEGTDPARTGVFNESLINIPLYMEGGTSDINALAPVRILEGNNFPKTPGKYYVWVTAREGHVVLGDLDWEIIPGTLSVEILPNSTANKTMNATNYLNTSLALTLNMSWDSPQLNVTLNGANETSLLLGPYGEANSSALFPVNITTGPSTPLGVYTGKIVANASNGQSMAVYMVISVVGVESGFLGPVRSIIIQTFKDPTYTTSSYTFNQPYPVTITGGNWPPGQTLTVNVFLNSAGPGSPVPGFPRAVIANETSGFSTVWVPYGATPGIYNVTVNNATASASWLFTITACP